MKVTSSVLAVLAFSASAFAEAEPKIRAHKGLCGYPGMTCAKTKRAAMAVADALAAAEPKIRAHKGLCGYPGMTCAKAKRSLSSISDALDATLDSVFERDADAEAEAKIRAHKGLCGYPGMTCARSAAPEPKIRAHKGLCGYPGMTCAKTKRGLDLVKEDQPDVFKDECFAEGGECNAVLKASEAFHEAVKREAEAARPRWRGSTPRGKKGVKKYKGLCGYPGMTCSRDTHDLAARDVDEVDFEAAEADCNGPNGDCTIVQRSLDSLEDALNSAVEEVYRLD